MIGFTVVLLVLSAVVFLRLFVQADNQGTWMLIAIYWLVLTVRNYADVMERLH